MCEIFPNEIYLQVLERVDWFSLQDLKSIFPELVEYELGKRLKRTLPFGETSGKICIVIKDIQLKSVYCDLALGKLHVTKDKYHLPWIRNVINKWFLYSFKNNRINLKGSLFKKIIHLMNRKNYTVNEIEQTLVFNSSNILINII